MKNHKTETTMEKPEAVKQKTWTIPKDKIAAVREAKDKLVEANIEFQHAKARAEMMFAEHSRATHAALKSVGAPPSASLNTEDGTAVYPPPPRPQQQGQG